MKKRIISLTLSVMVILSSMIFINAQSDEYAENTIDHIHSENCIYSCELDNTTATASEFNSQIVPVHIDHPGSENCIYSCILDNISNDVSNNSYIASLTEEAHNFIIEDINITEEDLNESLKNIIDEYTGVSTSSLEESKEILAETLEITVDELNELLSSSSLNCLINGHELFVHSCPGGHSNTPYQCQRGCSRSAECVKSNCDYTTTVTLFEEAHTWSTGWCAQTCTSCGTIQPLHAPGGCWYCS